MKVRATILDIIIRGNRRDSMHVCICIHTKGVLG